MAERTPADGASGRQVNRPTRFSPRAWGSILKRVWVGVGRDHLSIIAAGVAFYGVLAIFPGIAALISLYGYVADPGDISSNLDRVQPLLPADVFAILKGQVDHLVAAGQARLGLASLVSVVIALWLSRAGVSALIEGLNVVYRQQDTRNIILLNLVALGLTLLFILVAIVALLTVVALPVILSAIEIGVIGAALARLAPLVVLGVAVVFVIGLLYRYGPNRAIARKRWISFGAVAATLAWLLVSVLLSIYIARFSDFNKTYGSLGAIVGLMFWLYASAFVVLLGAELNAEMELQTERDTTTGRPKPMGERGAYVADHVA